MTTYLMNNAVNTDRYSKRNPNINFLSIIDGSRVVIIRTLSYTPSTPPSGCEIYWKLMYNFVFNTFFLKPNLRVLEIHLYKLKYHMIPN
jgi:hypothetical protein